MAEVATAVATVQAADLSVGGLFLQADLLIKMVVLGLAGASFWTWTIIIEKLATLKKLKRVVDEFETRFQKAADLRVFYEEIKSQKENVMTRILGALMASKRDKSTLDRLANSFINREIDILERQMVFLASVGSSAPFIGLFGTVWGIMNSFQSIGISKNTSLAVVAPGIAEALFATALGLVAAIPAVIAYNKFNNDITRLFSKIRTLSEELVFVMTQK